MPKKKSTTVIQVASWLLIAIHALVFLGITMEGINLLFGGFFQIDRMYGFLWFSLGSFLLFGTVDAFKKSLRSGYSKNVLAHLHAEHKIQLWTISLLFSAIFLGGHLSTMAVYLGHTVGTAFLRTANHGYFSYFGINPFDAAPFIAWIFEWYYLNQIVRFFFAIAAFRRKKAS